VRTGAKVIEIPGCRPEATLRPYFDTYWRNPHALNGGAIRTLTGINAGTPLGRCRAALKARIRPLYLSMVFRDLTAFSLHLNRFFRTFGAGKKRKSPAINNLHALSKSHIYAFPEEHPSC
jgi:hypothetical protein